MNNAPYIRCRKIHPFNLDDWDAVGAAFHDADFAPFQQGWIQQPTPGFRPARAAAAWSGELLYIHAQLKDDDIFNTMPGCEFNSLAINHGDVFEIFLQPSGQESYHEIHVTPNNQKFQLRIPCPGAFQKLKNRFTSNDDMIQSFKVWTPIVESRVKIDKSAQTWLVIVKIPLTMLAENIPAAPGVKWRFSFCRYDYTRPDTTPTYSSTSPHSAINYHLVHEYGTMEFC